MPASPPSAKFARLLYLLVCEWAGIAVSLSTRGSDLLEVPIWVGMVTGLLVAGVFIGIEELLRGFTLRGFSHAVFGLAIGLLGAWLLSRVGVSQLLTHTLQNTLEGSANGEELVDVLKLACNVALYASFGFFGVMFALRGNRDDFAFIIPYVRFRQDTSSGQPVVLDADSLIDGRILSIVRSGFLHGRLVIPRFVLDELHSMAGSSSTTTRQRAASGLANLEKIQADKSLQSSIADPSTSGGSRPAEAQLLDTARLFSARLLTLDDNLSKIARIQGVDVLNLNELDTALRPEIAIGQRMRVALVRPGKDDGQAVGYLPDGTMLVVNQSARRIGETIDVIVTSTLQTASGTMVFGEAEPKKS